MRYFVKVRLSENISETPEGFLVCLAVPIARTGEMIYGPNETPLQVGADGQVIITRDESEVFRPETIASFEGKPITITHPTQFVDPENWKDLSEGVVQNVRRGAGDLLDSLIADLLICGKDAINLVKNGLREVSCGYEADYEQTEDGKGKQFNIIGNHLALVDQGRAGSGYAINDHKGVSKMTIKELQTKFKAIFTDAQEKVDKIAEDASLGGKQSPQDPPSGKPATADESGMAMDELVKMCDDFKKMGDALAEKMASMKPKDAAEKKPEEKADDAEGESSGMEDRLKKLEAAVSKLLEMQAGDEKPDDDGKEKSEDAEKEEKEEMEDDDFEESTMVGDTASRAEILAPGIAMTKDVKAKALKMAYSTKEGKKIIESINGGKAPTFDSKEKIDILFTAASEIMKKARVEEFSKTKQTRDIDGTAVNAGFKSADDINRMNAEFYKAKH
jgi:hypothetical protein